MTAEDKMLDSLQYEELKFIFGYLNIKDISALSCVCVKLYNDINTFCECQCTKFLCKDSLIKLFENELMILSWEKETLNMLLGNDISYRWLFVSWLKLKDFRRTTFAKFSIIHTGDPANIIPKYDHKVGRDIAFIKYVSWLHFRYTFLNVFPGTYRVTMKVECNGAYRWKDGDPAKVSVYWEDSAGDHDLRIKIKPYEWIKEPRSLKTDDSSGYNIDFIDGWFYLSLEDFQITETSEVSFQFRDIDNRWWSSYARWDYVQLKRVDWNTIPVKYSVLYSIEEG